MYAVLGTVTITDFEHARRLLHDDVLPTITDVPGFVSGYWLAPIDGTGFVDLDLRDRRRSPRDGGADAARASAERVRRHRVGRGPRGRGQRPPAGRRPAPGDPGVVTRATPGSEAEGGVHLIVVFDRAHARPDDGQELRRDLRHRDLEHLVEVVAA